MRLKAINVYSSFLGEELATKERTGFLRKEADFLDYELCKSIKYINNSYCKQLNLCCNENTNQVVLGQYVSEGYPKIDLPFDFDDYISKTDFERGLFWINALKYVFTLLMEQYEFDGEKVYTFISYLEDKYSKNMFDELPTPKTKKKK